MAKSNLSKSGKIVNSKSTAKEVQKMTTEATAAGSKPAQKMFSLDSVDAGINEMIAEGYLPEEVRGMIKSGQIVAEIDQAEIEKGTFSGDYVRLSLGPDSAFEDQADAATALVVICGGNLRAPKRDDGESDTRKPSLEKFALYGADLAARSRVSQRIRGLTEGPEKAIEKMADQIQRAKPGTSRDKALARARKMLESMDEDE